MSAPLQAAAGIVNAREPLPHLVTAGQPTAEQLRALAAAGVQVVLDIRDPMEPRPMEDEPALVASLGMEYVNVPVSSGTLSDETMEQILGALRNARDREVFFHCGSANRVGGALIPYFILDKGMSEDQAVQEAMRVGLRSPEYLEWGLEYAQRQAGG